MPGSWEVLNLRKNRTLVATIAPPDYKVTMGWAMSMRQLQLPAYSDFTRSTGLPFGPARNSCLKIALEQGYNYLFFVDADTLVSPTIISDLINTGYDYIGALYYRRYPPYEPAPCMRTVQTNAQGQTTVGRGPLPNFQPGSIIPVDFLPTGATLFSRRVMEAVLRKFPKPFEWTVDIDNPASGMSEDFNFSVRAAEVGYQPMLHTGIICPHELAMVVTNQGVQTSPF